MKATKIKVGDEVRVTILDHCMRPYAGKGHKAGLTFNVYGMVIGFKDGCIQVAPWIEASGEVDGNTETFDLVLGAVLQIAVLKPARKVKRK